MSCSPTRDERFALVKALYEADTALDRADSADFEARNRAEVDEAEVERTEEAQNAASGVYLSALYALYNAVDVERADRIRKAVDDLDDATFEATFSDADALHALLDRIDPIS